MEKTNDVVFQIGQIIGNKSFISSLMQDMSGYSSERIEERLATVIKYYIATRDSQTDYTYQEIESKYESIKKLAIEPGMDIYRNAVTNGFFTHSFNGYKKDRIMQYGLNYIGNIKDEETTQEIQRAREMLRKLETVLGKSQYINDKHLSNEVFLTSPGNKTFFYACKNSPERLYLGPLKGYKDEPIVVGETKQTYMLRVLAKKIKQKYLNSSSPEYLETLELAKQVTEYFCSKQPAVAFLNTEQIKDMPVSSRIYKPEESQPLEEVIRKWIEGKRKTDVLVIKGEKGLNLPKNYSTSNGQRGHLYSINVKPKISGYKLKESGEEVEPIIQRVNMLETYGYGLKGEFKEVITGYRLKGTDEEVSSEDVEEITDGYYARIFGNGTIELQEDELERLYTDFPLESIFSFMKGDKSGDLGDLVTLAQYIPDGAIEGIIDVFDEFEMKQIFAKSKGMKVGDLIDYKYCKFIGEPSIEELLGAITPNCTEEDLEEIRKKYEKLRQSQSVEQKIDRLKFRKQSILSRTDFMKEGIHTAYTLGDILDEFEQKGIMSDFLEQDTTIAQDDLQYQSDIHGVSHTRRVNFLATAIMNMENITGRDREIIYEIIKNHDIGREHDLEDSKHGEMSVSKIEENKGRLEGFSTEEQELIKFVIDQHSKAWRENSKSISELPEEKRQRYEKILHICTDADKLDRVRLDPYGLNSREDGLDIERLVLNSSRMLEGVAYESYGKLLEILDIEKQIQAIQDEIPQEQADQLDAEFERRMQAAQKAIAQHKSETFLGSIIETSKGCGLVEISQNVKTAVMENDNTKRSANQCGR